MKKYHIEKNTTRFVSNSNALMSQIRKTITHKIHS